jgi:hypothetical protein
MRVMNVDAEVLRDGTEQATHAFEQTQTHIDAEIVGDIPPLMETLLPEGPYAYTLMPEVHPDGRVKIPILSTREEILEAYKMIRGHSWLRSVTNLCEIRGDWYTFTDNISRGEIKTTGDKGAHETLGLFPSGRGTGITGELIWIRVPRAMLGTRDDPNDTTKLDRDEMFAREDVLLQHQRYLDAVARADVDGVLATLHDFVASGVRDYVDETGTATTLEGHDAHRAFYEALFAKYEIRNVTPLDRVAEEWYVFAELRLTVSPREGADAGRELSFHTAEFHMPANDGRFIARIGHGTDPE